MKHKLKETWKGDGDIMGLFDSVVSSMGESPQIQEALTLLKNYVQGQVNAMAHFNTRMDQFEAKVDRMLFILEHPSNIAPAGDDGLMKLLAENGEEMQIQEIQPFDTAYPDGSRVTYV